MHIIHNAATTAYERSIIGTFTKKAPTMLSTGGRDSIVGGITLFTLSAELHLRLDEEARRYSNEKTPKLKTDVATIIGKDDRGCEAAKKRYSSLIIKPINITKVMLKPMENTTESRKLFCSSLNRLRIASPGMKDKYTKTISSLKTGMFSKTET